MYLKIHEHEKSSILALCDKELIGKVLSEKGIRLDLKDYASFYKGDLVSEKEATEAMRSATSMNLVGEKSVGVALKLGLVEKSGIRKIKGVPHVQIYRV